MLVQNKGNIVDVGILNKNVSNIFSKAYQTLEQKTAVLLVGRVASLTYLTHQLDNEGRLKPVFTTLKY